MRTQSGDVVVRKGHVSPLVFVVHSGSFEVRFYSGTNREFAFRLTHGQLLCVNSFLDQRPAPVTVTAVGNGSLWALDLATFRQHAQACTCHQYFIRVIFFVMSFNVHREQERQAVGCLIFVPQHIPVAGYLSPSGFCSRPL